MASSAPTERAAFIRQTYLHLAFAFLAFIGVEWFLLQQSWAPVLIQKMTGGMGWLLVLGAFMGVSSYGYTSTAGIAPVTVIKRSLHYN